MTECPLRYSVRTRTYGATVAGLFSSLNEVMCELIVEIEHIDTEPGSSTFSMHRQKVRPEDSSAGYFLPASPGAWLDYTAAGTRCRSPSWFARLFHAVDVSFNWT